MTDPEFAAVVGAAFDAFNERRFADFSGYVTEDLIESYPQSGERIEGGRQQRAMHEAFPSPTTFTIRTIRSSGDLAVVELDERYPDDSVWKTAMILELRGGLIATLTGYFGGLFRHRRPADEALRDTGAGRASEATTGVLGARRCDSSV